MAKNAPPPGTSDIFPDEIGNWQLLENKAREVFQLFGYEELRIPIFEYTEVFQRGIGDGTDIVQKEMYTFEDRGGRSLTLRPEGTAGVMRALLNTDVMNGNEKRVFYLGPMFRGERPAAGRKRQFHQVGVENAGRIAPELDAECIAMLIRYLSDIGITGHRLLLNTRGSRDSRPAVQELLKKYFGEHRGSLCDDCRKRLENNTLRILDCKQSTCQKLVKEAPDASTCFSRKSREFFDQVCRILSNLGIPFDIEPRLVRGLDYYVHTVFEVIHSGIGAQNSLAGGGRYEVFLPEVKKPLIGVGFGVGLERLLMARDSLGIPPPPSWSPDIFCIGLGETAIAQNQFLANELRKAGISVIAEVENRSMKAQLRAANRVGAKFAIIRGDDELAGDMVLCKDMNNSKQFELPVDQLLPKLREILP